MDARFPDRKTIHAVLTLATRAPSIHNAQPWRWVDAQDLQLWVDPERQVPNTDPDSRDLLLSCGASLHHAVVALAAMGWQAKVHWLPDPLHPAHLAAIEVSRHPASELDITLAAAIPRRRTDRRHYAWWPVPAADIALIGRRAAGAGVMLRQVESLPKLREIVVQAVEQHATDHDYLTELTAWSGRYASVSGVPARNIPKPDPTSPIPGRLFAGSALEQPPETKAADDGAVVLALGTEDDTSLAAARRRSHKWRCLPLPHWGCRAARSPNPGNRGNAGRRAHRGLRRERVSPDVVACRLGAGECRSASIDASPSARRGRGAAGRLSTGVAARAPRAMTSITHD